MYSDAIQNLEKVAGKISWEHWLDLVLATFRVRLAFGQEPVSTIALEEVADGLYKPVMLAEALQFYFSGVNDDSAYNLAVVMDTLGEQLTRPLIKLAQALANTHFTTNGQWEQHIGWSLEKIQSRAVEQLDILAAALDALVAIPDLFDFFRDWALVLLAPLLQESGLIIEAIIIAVGSSSNQFKTRSERIEILTSLQENLSNIENIR